MGTRYIVTCLSSVCVRFHALDDDWTKSLYYTIILYYTIYTIIIMVRVIKAKLVFTHHWWYWMKILKASKFSGPNHYATMTPALCQVYNNCYCVMLLYAGRHLWQYTGTDWQALHAFSWWLLWESTDCQNPEPLLGTCDDWLIDFISITSIDCCDIWCLY